MPFFLQEMLSSAPHPTPLRQAPKAPCCSEPACGSRPLESDPRLGLGTDRAERGGSRQGARPGCPAPGAACRGGGVVLAASPSPLLPYPQTVHPSSRRPAPHPPRRRLPRRLPALAQSRPGSQRASGALWDGTRRKRRRRRQRQHLGLLPRLPRAIPEESRGSRSGEEASDEDPGGCAPVSLPRRRRRLQVSGARSPRGPAWPRSPEAQTDRRTDRQSLGTHARGRAQRPAPRPVRPRAAPPAGRPLPPRAPGSRPLGAEGEGGWRCGTPSRGQLGRPGRASSASSLSPAQRAAATPQRPVGALCPAAGRPDLASTDPRKARLVERGSGAIAVQLASGSIPTPRLGRLVF
ncbi:hypothetical protein J1605_007719 [Eschrichtius robustus]|uniref:Uncharacterized protein n=1 Tax=Eschrichtius robustus TaxID=9764 RepID=A0AB34GS19_ESCRO|nr:hypothetical protein J1605_011404 [Eschrichtius robustus]KAJ8784837.1 hypothetical protein J1605_007864 [Eschrichtius robustus]KAJ8785163.1 hypothetical protein J1605_007719 [Eschrichtius robustus]